MRLNISYIVTKARKQIGIKWVVIIMLAIFLRLYNIQSFATFLGDQGRDALIMKDIVTLKHFPAIGPPTSLGQIYMGPFFYYLMAPFIFLSNFDPIGPAIGTALLSVIAVITAGYMVQKYTDRTTMHSFLIVLAFSSFLTDIAKYAWNPNLLPYFAFYTFFFFYEMLQKKNTIAAFLAGLFFGFSIQLHYLMLLSAIPLSIFLILFVVLKKYYAVYKNLLYASIGFLIALSPLIIFDLRHNFINTHSLLALFYTNSTEKSGSILMTLWNTAETFLHITIPFPTEFKTLTLLIIGFLLFQSIKRALIEKNTFILLHIFTVISYIVVFSLVNVGRYPHYYDPIFLSLYLILTFPLFKKKCLTCTAGGILFLVLFIMINGVKYNFLSTTGSNQINQARQLSSGIAPHISKGSYQLATIPFTEADEHIRYFLSIDSHETQLDARSLEQPAQLFVLCFTPCKATDDAQWVIASFIDKYIQEKFTTHTITVYKLIHKRVKIHK